MVITLLEAGKPKADATLSYNMVGIRKRDSSLQPTLKVATAGHEVRPHTWKGLIPGNLTTPQGTPNY